MYLETLDSPNIEMELVIPPKNAPTRVGRHMVVVRQGKLRSQHFAKEPFTSLLVILTNKFFSIDSGYAASLVIVAQAL